MTEKVMSYASAYIVPPDRERGTDFAYMANKQLKLAGHILEYKVYGRHFSLNQKHTIRDKNSPKTVHDPDDVKYRSYTRAKRTICDYVNSNSGFWCSSSGRPFRSVFVTLTFRQNFVDFNTTHPLFTSFIRSLSRAYFHFDSNLLKYVAVPEYQKRGAVHYHCIFFNLPFRHDAKSLFSSLWVHGFVQIKSVYRVGNVGRYVSKYLSKSFVEQGLSSRKSYFVSKGLHKPIVVCYDELINQIVPDLPSETLESVRKNIELGYLVSLDYYRYNLRDYNGVVDRARALMSQV